MNTSPDPEREKLVERYRSYAHAIAAEVLRRMPPQVERQDLESAAELGLVEAANNYDSSRGVQFKTFSYYRIRGSIYDYLRQLGWFPKAHYQRYRFEMAANEYMLDYAAHPSPVPGTEYEELRNVAGTLLSCFLLSLDEKAHDVPDTPDQSPESLLGRREDRARVRSCLGKLPEKNRRVLEMYYFEDKNLEEIGRVLKLSKSWVSRVHAKSLEMIREHLEEPAGSKMTGGMVTSTGGAR